VAIAMPHIDVVGVKVEEHGISEIVEWARLQIGIAPPDALEALTHHEVTDADATGDAGVAMSAIRAIQVRSAAPEPGGHQSAVKPGAEHLGGIHEYSGGQPAAEIAAGVRRCLVEAQGGGLATVGVVSANIQGYLAPCSIRRFYPHCGRGATASPGSCLE